MDLRKCGECGRDLTLDKFYKDGTDSEGNPKYRRDCKECYRFRRRKKETIEDKKKATKQPKRRSKK